MLPPPPGALAGRCNSRPALHGCGPSAGGTAAAAAGSEESWVATEPSCHCRELMLLLLHARGRAAPSWRSRSAKGLVPAVVLLGPPTSPGALPAGMSGTAAAAAAVPAAGGSGRALLCSTRSACRSAGARSGSRCGGSGRAAPAESADRPWRREQGAGAAARASHQSRGSTTTASSTRTSSAARPPCSCCSCCWPAAVPALLAPPAGAAAAAPVSLGASGAAAPADARSAKVRSAGAARRTAAITAAVHSACAHAANRQACARSRPLVGSLRVRQAQAEFPTTQSMLERGPARLADRQVPRAKRQTHLQVGSCIPLCQPRHLLQQVSGRRGRPPAGVHLQDRGALLRARQPKIHLAAGRGSGGERVSSARRQLAWAVFCFAHQLSAHSLPTRGDACTQWRCSSRGNGSVAQPPKRTSQQLRAAPSSLPAAHLAVKAAGPPERRVNSLWAVGGADDNHIPAVRHAIHQGQER